MQLALVHWHYDLMGKSKHLHLLVCLVEEPVGGKLQGQSPVLKLSGKKVQTFDNASSENELPV